MRESARKARAVLRDRRRGDDVMVGLFGPLSGFGLYLLNTYSTASFVIDLQTRARMLVEAEQNVAALQQATCRPRTMMPLMRAMLPRRHDGLRVAGRADAEGTMHYLQSDPNRPSQVYRRRLGHGTVSVG